jgi:hypothetical protein
MSNEILTQLLGTHAFDGSPLHVDMPAFHVPFDDRGRTGTETSVLRAARTVASGGLAGEVISTLAGVDLQRPAGEVLENVNRALAAISAGGRVPVIVVDDSDSFTRRHGSGRTRDELVGTFFGPVLRALTELNAGVIVAVHDEYLEMESFQRARREHGALERLLAIPPVRSG